MDERTLGLILRTRLLTETSLVVHWLTQDYGRIATIAKGARRAKSPFQGKLDLFYLADLSFRRSRRSELHRLHEVSVQDFNSALRNDLTSLQQAAYFVGLIERTTETDTPIPGVFELLQTALAWIPKQPPGPMPVLAFEAKLLVEQGLQPDPSRAALTAGAREILSNLMQGDWTTIARLRLASAQARELDRFLQQQWLLHLDKLPATRRDALNFGNGPSGKRPV